jgi:RimJ/RimL family protein N-acetyltransferase
MIVRGIGTAELDRFCGGDEQRSRTVRTLWDRGHSTPEWCLVGEEGGEFRCTVTAWSEDWPERRPNLFRLKVPWGEPGLVTGIEFLRRVVDLARSRGMTGLVYYFYTDYDAHISQRHELMKALEFRLEQEKYRYLWQDSGTRVAVPDRLRFRSGSEAGTDAFQEAICRVTEQTLDRQDRQRRESAGPEAAAQEMLNLFQRQEDTRLDWWQLAYLGDRLVGLVVPAPLDESEGSIDYIGVVPEARGQGYSDDLLARGVAQLQAAGFREVVAEIDTGNAPMIAAAERCGFSRTGTLWNYRRELASAT